MSTDTPSPAPPDETAEARSFFDRSPPEDYLKEWAERLAMPPEEPDRALRSFVVFRLAREWLALPAEVFAEVTTPQPIHAIPHRTNGVLLGLVNIRGQLRLAVSLHGLFDLESEDSEPNSTSTTRLLILRDGSDQWVFSVQEVAGIQRVAENRLRHVPSTLRKASPHTTAVFEWKDHTVGILQPAELYSSLRSHCQ
jgi:chemotaxis-related protein WspD